MIQEDTIELLKECNAGIKMGIDSINEVLPMVQDEQFKMKLVKSREDHEMLEEETYELLHQYGDIGEEPNIMAKMGSWVKTNIKMAWKPNDETISDLITDGCNMGVKSLNRYLNQYKAAEEKVKDITKKLITIEDELLFGVRKYL